MLKTLTNAELVLPHLLSGLEGAIGWSSLSVDYHKPHVGRLWRPYGEDRRIFLHKIHPCNEDEALFHPHPWPCAARVFIPEDAHYQTGFGWADPQGNPPPVSGKAFLENGSAYEMIDPKAWHYVRPVDAPINSLMVTGKPYGGKKQKRFGQERAHKYLSAEQIAELKSVFRQMYP